MPSAGLSEPALALLREAVTDPATVARYRAKTRLIAGSSCLWWLGAISARGHGRFWIGQIDGTAVDGTAVDGTAVDGVAGRRDVVVIAHRFAWALEHGVDALQDVSVLGHRCDNPLCQQLGPGHVQRSSHANNRREWATRRHAFNTPLRDSRGSRGRARQIRDVLRQDATPDALAAAVADGLRDDVEQLALWPGLDALDASAVA